jgi:hypothetical protein
LNTINTKGINMLDFGAGALDWSSLEKNLGEDAKGTKKNYKDDRFWTLSRDENDNGGAIIRLLPDPEGVPFEQMYSHAFQSYDAVAKKKRWYINNSPSIIGLDCPASDLWSAIFREGSEEGKMEAKNFSRKIQFYTNIKVINDPANPQNNGKIFIWKFGTKLKDKIMAALNPSETDRAMGEEPKQLFNPLSGCNIKLKIAKVAGFLNYDGTTIGEESSIYDNADEAKEDIINNAHILSEFKKEEAFETYDELLSKLKYVMECYAPKNLTPDRFKQVTDPVLGGSSTKEEIGTVAGSAGRSTETTPEPVVETAPAEPVKQAEEAPFEVDEPVKAETPTPKTETDDSSLDFLDDL